MPPIFAAIAAIASFVGSGFAALAGALGLTAGQLGLAALSLAGQLLFAKKPSVPTSEDGKVSLRQPTPPLRRGYGEFEVGGDYFFFRNRAGVAYQGIVFCIGPIEAIVGWKLHDEAITLDADGYIASPAHFLLGNGSPFGGPETSGGARVRVFSQLGSMDDPAYPALIDAFPEVVDEDFRTPGLVTGLFLAQTVPAKYVTKVFKQGLPAPRGRFLGVKVWDPRDPAQDPEDETTWQFSRSPTLCTLDYLRHWSGFGRPLSKIHVPEFEAAADIDDRLELGWDGAWRPRFELGGRYDLGDIERKVVLSALLSSADLWLYTRMDGTIGIKGGDWEEPTLRITDADIIALRQTSFDRITEGAEVLRGTYTSIDHKFSTTDAVAWPTGLDPRANADSTKKLEMPWVQRHRQMRLLLSINHDRMNAAKRGAVIITGRKLLEAHGKRFAVIHSPRHGLHEAYVEFDAPPAWTDRDQLAFSWRLVNPARYTLSPSAEGPPPPVKIFDTDDDLPAVTGFDVTIESEDIGGGRLIAYGLAGWDLPATDDLSHEVEYVQWVASAPSGPVRTLRVDAGETSARTEALPEGATFRFRARTVGPSGGAAGGWTTPILRLVEIDHVPPEPPALSLAPSGGHAVGTITAPNDGRVVSLRLYRVAGGDPFDDGDTPVAVLFTAPNQAHAIDDTPPSAGTFDYFGVSVGSYGETSDPTTAVSVTV